jgi:multidrug resistance efflux pump
VKKILIALLPLFLLAKVHYAKVEPIEQATIKSSVSGVVLVADQAAEGSVLGEKAFVQIDDVLDRANLKSTEASLVLFRENVTTNEEVLKGLKTTLDRKQSFYERMKGLETASRTQKDNAHAAYVGAKNQYLGIREKIITLKKQILDMEYKIAMLKDLIAKKHVAMPGEYLYKLMVHTGEFAAPGLPLAIVQDITRAQLIVYLDRDEIVDAEGGKIENKTIHIDGKPTKLKIDRIWKVADSQYISSYRARITLLPKYPFSKLVKIEFK